MINNKSDELTIHEDLILVNEDIESKEQIIKKLGGMLYKQGFVKDTYTQAVLDREIVYPTGLKARITGVAVPHTDTEHVIKPAVAVATLNSPVIFHGMGAPDTEIPIYVIMMLAIHDPKFVVDTLRKVILIIEKDEALKKILDAKSSVEIRKIMQEHIVLVSEKS